jgi:branched-chain amino acid transport system ATP-binding protein
MTPIPTPIPLIAITDLHAGYGNAQVLFGVNLNITAGQVTTLMGRNGMGKTTTVRCLMGLLKPSAGQINIRDQDITGTSPMPACATR